MKKICFDRVLIAIFLIAGITYAYSTASAANIRQIKSAMRARLPVINSLKKRGIVGEDNRGFLAFRGASRERADIVKAENRDRQQVYRTIAAKTGATPEDVGRRRARKIAEIAPPGVWIQKADGTWYKK